MIECSSLREISTIHKRPTLWQPSQTLKIEVNLKNIHIIRHPCIALLRMRYPPTCQILLLILCPLPSIEKKRVKSDWRTSCKGRGDDISRVFYSTSITVTSLFCPKFKAKFCEKASYVEGKVAWLYRKLYLLYMAINAIDGRLAADPGMSNNRVNNNISIVLFGV